MNTQKAPLEWGRRGGERKDEFCWVLCPAIVRPFKLQAAHYRIWLRRLTRSVSESIAWGQVVHQVSSSKPAGLPAWVLRPTLSPSCSVSHSVFHFFFQSWNLPSLYVRGLLEMLRSSQIISPIITICITAELLACVGRFF